MTVSQDRTHSISYPALCIAHPSLLAVSPVTATLYAFVSFAILPRYYQL